MRMSNHTIQNVAMLKSYNHWWPRFSPCSYNYPSSINKD